MEYPYEKDGWVYFNEECIVEQFVDVKWYSGNKKRYVSQGYIFTQMGDSLTVDVRDLQQGSQIKVGVTCPMCDGNRLARFKHIMSSKRSRCSDCGNIHDLEDNVYERLSVIKIDGFDKNRRLMWLCQCDCENKTIIRVRGDRLENGEVKSCGCLRKRGTNSNKLTQEEVESFVYKHYNGTVVVRGVYNGVREPLPLECLICGRKWNPQYRSISLGGLCTCATRFTQKEVEQNIYII